MTTPDPTLLPPAAPRIQLVLKVSKYCNLRCSYCYEFAELGDRQRMSLDNTSRLLANLRRSVDDGRIGGVDIVWHGGEPLLVPLDYYEQVAQVQRRLFPEPGLLSNVVQTNLTVLTPRHLAFLREGGFFEGVGVSFDVLGDQRVDIQGRLRNAQVVHNMQLLREAGVPFGAITVLCRATLPHLRQIQRFWRDLGIGCRVLPFHLSVDAAQHDQHGLSGPQQVAALQQCFADWLASPSPSRVEPINEYLRYAVSFLQDGLTQPYDPVQDEAVFVANLDGHVYGVGQGELYDPALAYGNLFSQSFSDILDSPVRARANQLATERMLQVCGNCPYFGHCPGHAVADASKDDLAIVRTDGCTVQQVLHVMVDRLRSAAVLDLPPARAGRRAEVAL